jgi:uncharacterized protein YoaH (UPF0181 family)
MEKKKTHNKLPYLLLTLIVVGGVVWVGNQSNAETWEKPIEIIQEVATPKKSVEDVTKELTQKVIDRIRQKESSGMSSGGDILYTLDPSQANQIKCTKIGGWQNPDCMSYGVMQMKISTVQRWYKQINGKEITQKEALLLALDDVQSVEFAKRVIIEIEGSVFEWSSTRGDEQYYNDMISTIRSLQNEKSI